MKFFKTLIAAGTVTAALCLSAVPVSAAATYDTQAQAVAGLTGRTLESVVSERWESGKTYGAIAEEAGVLTDFQLECIEMRKDRLAVCVNAGTLTQQQADDLILCMHEHQAICDNTGHGGCGHVQDGWCGQRTGAGTPPGGGYSGHGGHHNRACR